MNALISAKRFAKWVLKPLLYRFPPVFLSSTGLMLWFDEIVKTEHVEGDVIEIGSYLGGTAAMSSGLLTEIGSSRSYVVVDTFEGFVVGQFREEVKLGGDAGLRHHFSGNTSALARWVMDRHGGKNVKMICGDITQIDPAMLPNKISACLLDVDLAETIYSSLKIVYGRLSAGGVILVDDCDDDTKYKARIGYEKFVREANLPLEYRFGKGFVRKR